MKRIHIIGGKNNGKTTLVVDLVNEFRSRGIQVGTIKHTHHHHELDTPGKDSHQHREAGAAAVGILSPAMNAVFWPNGGNAVGDERYTRFESMFSDCRLVIVEGDTQTNAPKIEVWRAECGAQPLAEQLSNVIGLVTDDEIETSYTVLPRIDVAAIADFIIGQLSIESS